MIKLAMDVLGLVCICVLGVIGMVIIISFVLGFVCHLLADAGNSESCGAVRPGRPAITPTSPKPPIMPTDPKIPMPNGKED